MTDGLAPTNAVMTNPAAMKATLEQGGQNLVRGLQNFVGDMTANGGLPSMVDKSKFKVGENLGTTPGKVVYAEDHLELIQYAPQTDEVYATPIFIVPPQINKFYIWDLAPGRSIVEYLVAQGHQVFLVSWRNPGAEQADWGLASYVDALDRASAVACEITRLAGAQRRRRLLGRHHRGAPAGALGRPRTKRASSLTLLVAVLDVEGGKDTSMGLFANLETLELARMFSKSKGVLAGKDLERAFAWLRPNDLIWSYWVNNYLMGEEPPAFDILFWNADTTNLPAALHGDLMAMLAGRRPAARAAPDRRRPTLRLKDVTCDAFLLAGDTDHITPWDGCYLSINALGGKSEFVVSQSGHIQSLINPPGNPKARFLTNSGKHTTPEEFQPAPRPTRAAGGRSGSAG